MFDRSYRTHLRGGTMLLAIAASSLPSVARAENECGAVVAGAVVCDPGEASGIDRIVYMVDPAETSDLTVTFADGFAFEGKGSASAVYVSNVNGGVTIEGAGLDIVTNGEWRSGLMAASYNGDLNIDVRSVTTHGDHSAGLVSVVGIGSGTINLGSAETHGENSHGIFVEAGEGSDVTVNVAQIKTSGFSSDGVVIWSGGDAAVNAVTISTSGDWSFGINVTSAGSSAIAVEKVETTGYAGVGIVTLAYDSNADIRANEVTTFGEGGTGIVAQSVNGTASVSAGKVITRGNYSDGVAALSEFGNAHVRADEILTEGEFSFGIYSGSAFGDASAIAKTVTTRGHYADGVAVSAGNSATAQVKDVSTQGDYAYGVFALGGSAHIQASGAISTTGNESSAIAATSRWGDAVVDFAGPVTTAGRNAHGLDVAANLGGKAVVNGAGSILTTGATAHGVRAIAFTGDADIKVSKVETRGEAAHGIVVETSAETGITPTAPIRPGIGQPEDAFGTMRLAAPPPSAQEDGSFDINILAGEVSTSGIGSIGLKARSAGAAKVDVGAVTARAAKAISIEALGAATLDIRGAVKSVNDDGALVSGSDVNVSLAAGSSLSGGINGLIVRANGPAPAPEQPLPAATGAALISNSGLIRGGEGHAILVETGNASVDNRGTVIGSVWMGEGDDTFLNAGAHEIWKDSDFGAGSDRYNNLGELRLAAGSTAAEIRLSGLDLFDNQGLIDLTNGTAGETLHLSGDYRGSGAASLSLDLDPSTGKVDRLAVAGKLDGSTKLSFSVKGEAALLGDERLVIAKGGAGSAEDAFQLSWADAGFVRYGVSFDAATSEYLLVSDVGEGAYRASSIAAGIRHGLSDLGDSWASRDAGQRDAGEIRRGFWAVGSLATAKGQRGFEAAGDPSELHYEEDRQSYLAGTDLWGTSEESGLSGGLLAGYQHGTFDFRNSGDESRTETALVGAYASYRSGPVFATLMAHYARHWLRYEANDLSIDERSTGSSLGARLEAGYRIGADSWFFEPVVSLAVHKHDLNSFKVGEQSLELSGRTAGRVSIGARSGASFGTVAGVTVRGNAAAGLSRHVGSKETILLSSGDEHAEARADRETGSVWTTLGLDLDGSGPLSGFTQLRLERSDDLRSHQVRAGFSLKL